LTSVPLSSKKGVISMILSLEEAREALRIDGEDNDTIIIPLVVAIPKYLEITTGNSWMNEDGHCTNELAKVAAKFILQLWYYPQSEDAVRIQRTIDSLLLTLGAEARGMNELP
jgi:hypothetical protein